MPRKSKNFISIRLKSLNFITIRLVKLTIGRNPWQCICLRETIVWARTSRIQVDKVNFNTQLPSCVVLPETVCLKDPIAINPYDIFEKYSEGVATEDTGRNLNELWETTLGDVLGIQKLFSLFYSGSESLRCANLDRKIWTKRSTYLDNILEMFSTSL